MKQELIGTQWEFNLPVRIVFGCGKRYDLKQYIDAFGGTGILVSSKSLAANGTAGEIVKAAGGRITAVFSDVRPNPTTENTDACAELIRKSGAAFTVALGGGSVMDCCKAASAIALGNGKISEYYSGKRTFSAGEAVPMLALPTTSGTASEVTNIAVLTDVEKNIKAPINHEIMYPAAAIVDPELTLTVPPQVTASTGLDVLSHAVESYWSTLSQPICRACSIHSARLVFEWLPRAYAKGGDITAREKMAEASIAAGVAFSHPRTTASHACSFPLTNLYGVPHGEACAMTLDYFVRYNAEKWESPLLQELALACGFADPGEMADGIARLKKQLNVKTTLREIGCTAEEDIRALAKQSMSPLVNRNPVPLGEEDIYNMYLSIK